jgi:SAM-dependent methyltransferase
METNEYRFMAKEQLCHWWYRGRRDIIRCYLDNKGIKPRSEILEVGCGPGGNLIMLKNYGKVHACELDAFSREYASSLSGVDVKNGWLPDNIPFKVDHFDVVCLFDVIEHIENDVEAVRRIVKNLNKNGKLIITVPAAPFLFGKHDKNMHHFRRYNIKSLSMLLDDAGIHVECIKYFNSILFPLAVVTRFFDFFRNNEHSVGSKFPHKFVNEVLYRIFSFERFLFWRMRFPFGLSLICVGHKR